MATGRQTLKKMNKGFGPSTWMPGIQEVTERWPGVPGWTCFMQQKPVCQFLLWAEFSGSAHFPRGRKARLAGWGPSARESHLHVGEVHTVEVAEHLVDLGGVLQHCARRLSQVIEGCVSAQGLGEGTDHRNLGRAAGRVSPAHVGRRLFPSEGPGPRDGGGGREEAQGPRQENKQRMRASQAPRSIAAQSPAHPRAPLALGRLVKTFPGDTGPDFVGCGLGICIRTTIWAGLLQPGAWGLRPDPSGPDCGPAG